MSYFVLHMVNNFIPLFERCQKSYSRRPFKSYDEIFHVQVDVADFSPPEPRRRGGSAREQWISWRATSRRGQGDSPLVH